MNNSKVGASHSVARQEEELSSGAQQPKRRNLYAEGVHSWSRSYHFHSKWPRSSDDKDINTSSLIMAPSTSSAKMSIKDIIPYEQRSRLKWDSSYRDKHRDDTPSSDSEDDEDDPYELNPRRLHGKASSRHLLVRRWCNSGTYSSGPH